MATDLINNPPLPLAMEEEVTWYVDIEDNIVIEGISGDDDYIVLTPEDLANMAGALAQYKKYIEDNWED